MFVSQKRIDCTLRAILGYKKGTTEEMEKTLREVCAVIKVSRRAVQGYEKAGLVSASGHNNRGYLLYNEEAQKRIRNIKMYQEFGFTIKEIVNIIDAPDAERKTSLIERLERLKEKQLGMEAVIQKLDELIQSL